MKSFTIKQIVVVLDPRPLYHMAETSQPIWVHNSDSVVGDEDLTADGEGGSSGYPSEEEKNEEEDEEEEEGEVEIQPEQIKKDDSSSVQSIKIFPRKNYVPTSDEGIEYNNDTDPRYFHN